MRGLKLIQLVVIAALLAGSGIGGCTKTPNKDDLSKLEEAKIAAENAEKTLYEKKQERMRLETEHQQKSEDVKKEEGK